MQMGSAVGLARWQLQSLLVKLGCAVVPKITIGILGPRPFGWVERAQPNRACHRVAPKSERMGHSESVSVGGGGYRPAILNLWWRRRSQPVPGRGPAVRVSR